MDWRGGDKGARGKGRKETETLVRPVIFFSFFEPFFLFFFSFLFDKSKKSTTLLLATFCLPFLCLLPILWRERDGWRGSETERRSAGGGEAKERVEERRGTRKLFLSFLCLLLDLTRFLLVSKEQGTENQAKKRERRRWWWSETRRPSCDVQTSIKNPLSFSSPSLSLSLFPSNL